MRLDLDLIPVLQALVQHRSATRAGMALGLTQPQVSRSLARLRLQVGDPLLTRSAGAMEPTDVAIALVAAWAPALAQTAALLQESRTFDPATSARTYRVSMNDYESAVLLPPLFAALQRSAPKARLAVISRPPGEVAEALAQGRIELAVGRFLRPGTALRRKPLFDETLVAAARIGHPLARGKPTLARFVAFPHVLVSPGGGGDFSGLLDDRLLAVGAARSVPLSLSQFLLAPLVASQSDAVVVLPSRLLPLVEPWGVRAIAAPIALPHFQVSMLWRERSQHDPAHRWLRQRLGEAVAAVGVGRGRTAAPQKVPG